MKDIGRDLSQLLDLLKSKGVASYSGTLDGQPVSVTFEAAPARPLGLPVLPSQLGAEASEMEACPCGHEVVGEHNAEGCLRGCDAEDCAPKKAKRRKETK